MGHSVGVEREKERFRARTRLKYATTVAAMRNLLVRSYGSLEAAIVHNGNEWTCQTHGRGNDSTEKVEVQSMVPRSWKHPAVAEGSWISCREDDSARRGVR